LICVEYPHDCIFCHGTGAGKLLAVSLLDFTIKVFFTDSLKFFLSLYGHKLPVLSMDISSDSTLLVSGGADKNIKIWGLDFGDCHRSLFAHADSVMQVAFVHNTHYVFTAGKLVLALCIACTACT
jgi:U3 small nucleolar RNA-associated protein 12